MKQPHVVGVQHLVQLELDVRIFLQYATNQPAKFVDLFRWQQVFRLRAEEHHSIDDDIVEAIVMLIETIEDIKKLVHSDAFDNVHVEQRVDHADVDGLHIEHNFCHGGGVNGAHADECFNQMLEVFKSVDAGRAFTNWNRLDQFALRFLSREELNESTKESVQQFRASGDYASQQYAGFIHSKFSQFVCHQFIGWIFV